MAIKLETCLPNVIDPLELAIAMHPPATGPQQLCLSLSSLHQSVTVIPSSGARERLSPLSLAFAYVNERIRSVGSLLPALISH